MDSLTGEGDATEILRSKAQPTPNQVNNQSEEQQRKLLFIKRTKKSHQKIYTIQKFEQQKQISSRFQSIYHWKWGKMSNSYDKNLHFSYELPLPSIWSFNWSVCPSQKRHTPASISKQKVAPQSPLNDKELLNQTSLEHFINR